MNIKKLKVFAPMLVLTTGLTFMAPTVSVYAEESLTEGNENAETNQEINDTAGAVAQVAAESLESIIENDSEDEDLYVENEDNFQLDDIEDNSGKTQEELDAEAAAQAKAEAEAAEAAAQAKAEAEKIEQDKAKAEAVIGSTIIDPEDEEYNTGRNEIPDTVKTEAERKDIEPLKTPEGSPEPTPEKTPGKTPEGSPEPTPEKTPAATPVGTPVATPFVTPAATPVATQQPVITYINEVPKTGMSLKQVGATGFGVGLVTTVGLGLHTQLRLEDPLKIKATRKKYRKKSKKRKR